MIDISDLMAFVGAVVIGVGLYLITPPLALVWVGGLLFFFGIIGAIKRG